MKPDESALLKKLAAERTRQRACLRDTPLADDAAAPLGIHPRRANYLPLKWADRGWREYGVSARTGWVTEAGLEAAAKLGGGDR